MVNRQALSAFKRAASLGVSTWKTGSLLTYLVDAKESGGSYSLIEAVIRPGNEPPPHVHSREDELFYVVDGHFDVFVGDESFQVTSGGCVFMPRAKPHAFIIRSPRLHVLALFTPGGLEEAFRANSMPARTLDLPGEAVVPATESPDAQRARLLELGVRILAPNEIASQLPLYHQQLTSAP